MLKMDYDKLAIETFTEHGVTDASSDAEQLKAANAFLDKLREAGKLEEYTARCARLLESTE